MSAPKPAITSAGVDPSSIDTYTGSCPATPNTGSPTTATTLAYASQPGEPSSVRQRQRAATDDHPVSVRQLRLTRPHRTIRTAT